MKLLVELSKHKDSFNVYKNSSSGRRLVARFDASDYSCLYSSSPCYKAVGKIIAKRKMPCGVIELPEEKPEA